jgi:hypothetical protein
MVSLNVRTIYKYIVKTQYIYCVYIVFLQYNDSRSVFLTAFFCRELI